MVLNDWLLVGLFFLLSIPLSMSEYDFNNTFPYSHLNIPQEYTGLPTNPQIHKASPRSLQSIPKLYIKLQDPTYISRRLVLTIRDVCRVTNGFECIRVSSTDPSYVPNQIPTPIRLEFVSAGIYAYAEYSNTFSGPITLDVAYLTSGGFLRQDYIGSNTFQGTPVIQPVSNLRFNFRTSSYSSSLFGYLLGPFTGQITLRLRYDDDIVMWMQDSEVLNRSYENYNPRDIPYNCIGNSLYYTKINLNNRGGTDFRLEVSWNASGVWSSIPSTNMFNPTRISNMPFQLSSLRYNTYCDDVGGFSCIVCDIPLCLDCEQTKSAKKCILCKTNSYVNGSICSCNPGYYLPTTYNSDCLVCTGLCDECGEVSGVYKCKTCQSNASLSLGVCSCYHGYYISASNSRICMQCTGLCDECEEVSGVYGCKTCQSNASLSLGVCSCNHGYYISASNYRTCMQCTGLCDECEEVGGVYKCKACQSNASLSLGVCTCYPKYYVSGSNSRICMQCTGLCDECEEVGGVYKCKTCQINSSLILGVCSCNPGYIPLTVVSPNICFEMIKRCIDHVVSNLTYICRLCETGYRPASSGYCTECGEGYVKVVENPTECTQSIPHCIDYIKIDNVWVCNTCDTGYRIDPYSKCFDCESGYSIVSNDPFTCGIEIAGCISYYKHAETWFCERCGDRYKVGCENACCDCNIDEGYIKVSDNPISCIVSIPNCIEYQQYQTEWGCKKCEPEYQLDTTLKCGECNEGFRAQQEDPLICLAEISGCEEYRYDENLYECSRCEYYYFLCQGKCCECNKGFYISKSKPNICVKCPDKCNGCKEIDGIVKCLSCEYGYIVINDTCECDLEDFYINNDKCIPKPFEITVIPDTNLAYIRFNKPLNSALKLDDIEIIFNEELDRRLINFHLIVVQDKLEYILAYDLSINIQDNIDISLSFSTNVKDRQGQSVEMDVIYTNMQLDITGINTRNPYCDSSCKDCGILEGRLICSSCYDYGYIESSVCKCYVEDGKSTAEQCPQNCPSEMIKDEEAKTCKSCESCIYGENSDSDSSQSQTSLNEKESKETMEKSSSFSSTSSNSALAIGTALGADKVWSLMNTIQIYTYIPLFAIDIPIELAISLKSQDGTSKYFDILTQDISRGSKPFEKANEFKYETAHFIKNCIKPIGILIVLISLNLLFQILHTISRGKLKHYLGMVLGAFYYKVYIRYFIQMYLDILTPSVLQLIYVNYM